MIYRKTNMIEHTSDHEAGVMCEYVVDSGQVPLSQLFQKSLDTWECPTCMITNKNTDTTCAACCDPKPTTGHDAPTVSVNSVIVANTGTL